MKQPTDERIRELATEAARHVMMPHNAAAVAHNTEAIAHAIDTAVQEERRAWGEWKKAHRNGKAKT